jgi:carbonic anhydrase
MGSLYTTNNKALLHQDKFSAHHARAFLVTCMDFRFLDDETEYMKNHGYDVNYDIFVLAGVSIGINQTQYPEWEKTLYNHIEISQKLHSIQKVVLFDHLDCGAYKTFLPGFSTEEEERELHVKELEKAAKKIKEKFPDLKVVCKIMHFKERKVEKILVLK